MGMSVLPACLHMHHAHAWCLQRSEESTVSPGTGTADGCKLPCGYWEVNPCCLEEQVL